MRIEKEKRELTLRRGRDLDGATPEQPAELRRALERLRDVKQLRGTTGELVVKAAAQDFVGEDLAGGKRDDGLEDDRGEASIDELDELPGSADEVLG